MKNLASILTILASATAAHAFVLVPNGDFSTPAGDSWNFDASAGSAVTFETTGGNPDAFGKIDATAGTWGGVLVAEGGTGVAPAGADGIPLATLGLTPGEQYTFQWDQIDLLGNGATAGIKLESWLAGGAISDSGDQLVATNASWTTQSFDYTIDPTADAIKVVLVQNNGFNENGGAITGFDNVGVVPEPTSALLIGLGGLGLLIRRRS